jgi:GrpB-like predicted nucleotidyltransferase (UPF0157 family)
VAEADGRVCGAAWSRILAGPDVRGYGNVDGRTPELAISVQPDCRGAGIGTALMTSLFAELAGRGYERLSLSVQKENPAAKLYEWLGFEKLSESEEDYIMVRDLARPWYDIDLACLWTLFPIELREYDAAWRDWYADESVALGELLGGLAARISHIGSTAVPGLVAKPIVDILIEIDRDTDIDTVAGALAGAGWLVMADTREPRLRVDLNKGYTPSGFAERVYHLHVVRTGDNAELFFRDWLMEHEDERNRYAELKRRLAQEYRNDRDCYTAAKESFVREITAKAVEAYVVVRSISFFQSNTAR